MIDEKRNPYGIGSITRQNSHLEKKRKKKKKKMRCCNIWASIHRTYHTWIKTSRPFRSSTPYIIFVIAFSAYTDQFLYAAIVPVTPFALQQSQAGGGHIASPSQIQSWTTILLAVFGAGCFLASPPWAWFTDHATTRRRPFLLGLLVLWAATILLWFAPNFATQVAGRLAQGLSSAVVWTTGFAVLADTVDSGSLGEVSFFSAKFLGFCCGEDEHDGLT